MAEQTGWRWCRRCSGLVFGERPGVCFDGGPHDVAESGAYVLTYGEAPPDQQIGWRWCRRCEGLGFAGGGGGVCSDGSPHDFSQSAEYSVPVGATAPAAQEGWRSCQRCEVLVYEGGGGACFDGDAHDFSLSWEYSVRLEEVPLSPVLPPPSSELTLEIDERFRRLDVSGAGYSPGSPVALTYQWGAEAWTSELVADETGQIYAQHSDTASGTCTVTAHDLSTGEAASARSTLFRPRLGNGPVVIDPGTDLESADG